MRQSVEVERAQLLVSGDEVVGKTKEHADSRARSRRTSVVRFRDSIKFKRVQLFNR